ncbi:RxLR effector protein CRE2 [Phytophthora ramorum]|uniref:RxLR effector protein CRE2 n=1 Tax=Phytophthora ramorum TaxID=164328 RepID=UPI003098CC08|nr:RxLR effector protein CRE2 [Phytophthora ramorum]
MRLMLWILLVTVVTLLASTDAADTTTTSKLESIEAPGLLARALSPEYIADGKRSLRVRGNVDATDDDGGDESYIGDNDEERAISMPSFLDSFLAKVLYKMRDAIFKNLYKKGNTPSHIEAKYKGGSPRKSQGVADYRAWYEENVAAGVIKALD